MLEGAQDVVRQVFGNADRVGCCGRYPAERRLAEGERPTNRDAGSPLEALGVDGGVDAHRCSDGRWELAGLQRCAMPLRCLECLEPVALHHASCAATALVRWAAEGGLAVLLTLTVPHVPEDRLGELLTALFKAWQAMRRSRRWGALCEAFGLEHWLGSLECNVSPAHWSLGRMVGGWHPHLQLLGLVNGAAWAHCVDEEQRTAELEAFRVALSEQWAHELRRAGHERELSLEHGVGLEWTEPAEAAGRYVFKQGLEVFSPGGKLGRGDGASVPAVELAARIAARLNGRTVWAAAAADPEVRWLEERLEEWHEATQGVRFAHWSGRVRRELLADVPKLSTAEVRSQARKLREDDRARLDAALAELAARRGAMPDVASAEEPEADEPEGQADEPEGPEAPDGVDAVRFDPGVWSDLMAVMADPERWASPDAAPELLRLRARRVPPRTALLELLERYGGRNGGWLLASSLARPCRVLLHEESGWLVLVRRQAEAPEGWTEVEGIDRAGWARRLDELTAIDAARLERRAA